MPTDQWFVKPLVAIAARWPRQSFTSLHAQARQSLGDLTSVCKSCFTKDHVSEVDLRVCSEENVCLLFLDKQCQGTWHLPKRLVMLNVCFKAGAKMAPDQMPHYVAGVSRNRIWSWAADIRLACAAAEYLDLQEMSCESGVFEFDATRLQRPLCISLQNMRWRWSLISWLIVWFLFVCSSYFITLFLMIFAQRKSALGKRKGAKQKGKNVLGETEEVSANQFPRWQRSRKVTKEDT